MKTHSIGSFVLSVLIVTGCGYNPKSSKPANPDSAIPSSSGEVGAPAPDLGGKLEAGTAADVGGDVARDSQLLSDGAGGTAGTTGTAETTGTAGTTGGGGARAGATAETGGTLGAGGTGGTTSTGTTPAGGSTANPDASPDLPPDVPVTVTCPSPKAPSNGNVSAPSLAVGAVATYTCATGYGSPTVASRTCQGDGTWTGTDALCNLVDCGAPPVIANSKVSAPSTTYNANASYTCDPGYSASVSTVITCESSGRWSTVPMVCNPVNCGTPPSVANADVIALTTILGSVATTKCKSGFALTGTTNTRTCQTDGSWSLPAPACHVAECGTPPPIANGTVYAPKTTFNEVASYSCAAGFVLSGLAMRACQENETWYGAAPTCQVFTPKLTINRTGSGLGTVASSSSTAINCGTTCAATFTYNTEVTITATADAGQSFVGWDGAGCKGKVACTIRMTSDTVVNAVFSPPPNIVFVTSTRHSPNLGGLEKADEICTARATAGGLAGTYKAWLSTSTVNAKDRLVPASGWVRRDGKPVLNQIKDIESNKIFYPPSLDESGNTQPGAQDVITGTGSNGTLVVGSSATTCGDWTSNVDEPSKWYEVGIASSSSSAFTSYGGNQCTMPAQLYCFGIDRIAFVAPDPMQGRRAFTSNGTWTSGAGIESADTLCQQEATAAGLSGTFRALLTPTGASAASRFVGVEPWYRMDGLALATSASVFFSNDNSEVAPNLNAKGEYMGRQMVWTGGESMTSVGTNDSNCNNWMSALATANSRVGFGDMSYKGLFFGTNMSPYPCNSQYHLVCLQTP